MKNTVRSEAEAQQVSKIEPIPDGWYDSRINTAIEKLSKYGKDMIELEHHVSDAKGNVRTVRDWLLNNERSAAKLRHICEAVGALDHYESGEISQDDFPGHDVQVKIGIQKGTRAFPGDRNVIEDY